MPASSIGFPDSSFCLMKTRVASPAVSRISNLSPITRNLLAFPRALSICVFLVNDGGRRTIHDSTHDRVIENAPPPPAMEVPPSDRPPYRLQPAEPLNESAFTSRVKKVFSMGGLPYIDSNIHTAPGTHDRRGAVSDDQKQRCRGGERAGNQCL